MCVANNSRKSNFQEHSGSSRDAPDQLQLYTVLNCSGKNTFKGNVYTGSKDSSGKDGRSYHSFATYFQ